MQVGNTIKHISNYLSENPLEEPREIQELQTELKNSKTVVKAMRTIVSMMQLGHDVSGVYSDVLKIIDTSNYQLKLLCSFYLKSICLNKPACQLMCTQTFIKDFNEINPKIQKLAVHDAIILCDEILLKNYVEEIKRMCKHSNSEIRHETTRSIAYFYLKNTKLFKEEEMILYLKELVKDKDIAVKIGALDALAFIEQFENVVSSSEILKLSKSFYDKGFTKALRSALNVLKHKRLTESSRELYIDLLNSNDICIFYLAASKLIENGVMYQTIYDSCLYFMDVRPEQQYNMLSFIFTFVDKVKIDSSDFAIFSSDPCFIKKLKLKILFRAISKKQSLSDEASQETPRNNYESQHERTDLNVQLKINREENAEMNKVNSTISTQEVLAIKIIKKELERSKELSQFIIYNAVFFNVYIENALEDFNNESVLDMIVDLDPKMVSEQWKECISDFLFKIKNIHNPKIFLSLAYKYSMKIPKSIFKYEVLENHKKLIQFYVAMRDRNAISEHQCYNYIKNFSKKFPLDGFFKLILLNLPKIRSEDVCQDITIRKRNDCESVDFETSKSYDDIISFEDNNFENIQQLELLRNNSSEKIILANNQKNKEVASLCEKVEPNNVKCCNKGEISSDIQSECFENVIPVDHFNTKNYDAYKITIGKESNNNTIKGQLKRNHSVTIKAYDTEDVDSSKDLTIISTNNENCKIDESSDQKTSLINKSDFHTDKAEESIIHKTDDSYIHQCFNDEKVADQKIDDSKFLEEEKKKKETEINFKHSIIANIQTKMENEDNQSIQPGIATKTIFPIYVDTASLKGTIALEGKSMILTVDILEKAHQMECKIGSFTTKNTIRSEGRFTISHLPKVSGTFSIKIGDFKVEGNLD